MIWKRNICLFCGVFMLISCSSRALHDAQRIVAEADSVCAAGQIYTDSVPLAQAYHTLRSWRAAYPEEYAHCCYHYGRLLREREDPVAAMQVFINAIHSGTHDYRILGRVYDNIGDIAHRAEEYALSHDMFEQSANMYLRNGDTLSYYYCLNDMAFELAEQGKKEEAYTIIQTINDSYHNISIQPKLLETKAVACKKVQQYDSAIYYINEAKSYGYVESLGILICAQAYSYMGIKDSATYYANMVLKRSELLYDVNNALYILTEDDQTKDLEAVRQVAADRADTQKLIEISRSKLSQAVQLLEQDLHHETDWTWLYAILITLIIVSGSLSIYIVQKRKRHQLLSQQIDALETRSDTTITQMKEQIDINCKLFANSPTLKKDICWNDYDTMCDVVNRHFYLLATKLKQKQVLNEKEIRLCILVLLDMNRAQISDILPYALNSVGKLKDQTAKKLGTTGKNLRYFLIKMASEV